MSIHNSFFEQDQQDNLPREDARLLNQEPPPIRYLNKLMPPVGTSYFRFQTFTPINGTVSDAPVIGWKYLNLLWNIDAYVYVVRALPDDDFVKNGGAVYIVLVHGGSASTGNGFGPGFEYRYSVTPRGPGRAVTQLPMSDTGIMNGDITSYPITFSQDMQVFRQQGNDTFTFPAQYENSITYNKGEQTGMVRGSGVQWGTKLTDTPILGPGNFPFGSFSLFQRDSVQPLTFECTASVYADGATLTAQTETINIHVPRDQFEPVNSTRAWVAADDVAHVWRGFPGFLEVGSWSFGSTVSPLIDGALSNGFGWSTLFWFLCTAYLVSNLVRITAIRTPAGKEASHGRDDKDTSTAVSSGNL